MQATIRDILVRLKLPSREWGTSSANPDTAKP